MTIIVSTACKTSKDVILPVANVIPNDPAVVPFGGSVLFNTLMFTQACVHYSMDFLLVCTVFWLSILSPTGIESEQKMFLFMLAVLQIFFTPHLYVHRFWTARVYGVRRSTWAMGCSSVMLVIATLIFAVVIRSGDAVKEGFMEIVHNYEFVFMGFHTLQLIFLLVNHRNPVLRDHAFMRFNQFNEIQ